MFGAAGMTVSFLRPKPAYAVGVVILVVCLCLAWWLERVHRGLDLQRVSVPPAAHDDA
jgi:hypothetical protein